ncbi:SemiSWEET family sugar transporter [Rickettsia endosymbiont of Halotydeus destructor]|uniref:SemiSWEET family sugar transporter n=1 Tax=Rickettsia endosymbiont of Halotydeus destructor TaxID=2996754 RepID=UPI003BAFCC32
MLDYTEIMGYIAGILTTIAFVPQVIKTYQSRSTQNISLSMYVLSLYLLDRLHLFNSFLLLTYLNATKPLILDECVDINKVIKIIYHNPWTLILSPIKDNL